MLAPAARRPSRFLSGNDAFALGAFEAGVSVAAAYPGTPSTEIVETLATFERVQAEWSALGSRNTVFSRD
jgi:TPP-dependent indolepyruvate ferredoxin oxidoreductase alpha subunit